MSKIFGQNMKRIKISPYNPLWPAQFECESALISAALGPSCVDIHHIGSTSVLDLSAKENIDILCIVDKLENSLILQEIGYVFKGEINVPLRYYFSKSTPNLKVNLHVVPPAHGFIQLNLCFRNYLRNNAKAKSSYEKLKYSLIKNPVNFERKNGGFVGYTLEKDTFIKSILDKANFDGLMINFCTHANEWEAYHHMREKLLFSPINIKYDRNHLTIYADNHFHLVMYKGTKIVSVAQVELLDEAAAILRSLATDTPYQRCGYGSKLLVFIEKWLKNKRVKIIKTHAELRAQNFYHKLGYVDVKFDDTSISNSTIKLGKFF